MIDALMEIVNLDPASMLTGIFVFGFLLGMVVSDWARTESTDTEVPFLESPETNEEG